LVVDEGGEIVASYDADEFGNPTVVSESGISSSGRWIGALGYRDEVSETGLYYLRQRYYDPSLGRFLTRDPIGILGGLNLYGYVLNNPVNFVDPNGLEGYYNVQIYYDPRLPVDWKALEGSIESDLGMDIQMLPAPCDKTGSPIFPKEGRQGSNFVVNLKGNISATPTTATGGGGLQMGITPPTGRRLGSPSGAVSNVNFGSALAALANSKNAQQALSTCSGNDLPSMRQRDAMSTKFLVNVLTNTAKHELGHSLSSNPWETNVPGSIMNPMSQQSPDFLNKILPYDAPRIEQIRNNLRL
jgi:RHS repeat-associated protein